MNNKLVTKLVLVLKLKVAALWAVTTGMLILNACATTELRSVPLVSPVDPAYAHSVQSVAKPSDLKVMTLNIAHSRSDGFHQMLQSSDTATRNLDAIMAVLRVQDPDVVALQEADGPSFWSGGFDHVEYLAKFDALSNHVRGEHVRGLNLSYGTALISEYSMRDPLSVVFSPGLSPLTKGFLVSTIAWPGMPTIEIDVVSVHLDPLSSAVRSKQALELVRALQQRNRPVILMGDFNTDWQAEQSALRLIATELGLKAYQPENQELQTFTPLGKRLDWILVSEQFEFVSYAVLPDVVSDHQGVVAQLALVSSVTQAF